MCSCACHLSRGENQIDPAATAWAVVPCHQQSNPPDRPLPPFAPAPAAVLLRERCRTEVARGRANLLGFAAFAREETAAHAQLAMGILAAASCTAVPQ